jgi:two-component system cell cycle sensor histidine kinase/response regulator CckA
MKDVLFMQDMDLNVTYTSPSVTQLFGYSVEEALKVKIADLMTPGSLNKALETFQTMVTRAEKQEEFDIPFMEYEYVRKDGTTFWGELKVTFLRDSKGSLVGSQGILRNVDERKRSEEALKQSEFRFRTLFNLSPQAIALTEVETGRLIDVNEKFCELTKYTKQEIVGRTTTEMAFYADPDRNRFTKELKSKGEVKGLEMDFKVKDGAMIQARMYARVIQFEDRPIILTVFYDLSEEKRLWNQFQQAQKMEAIGNLAGGVAHDFNNLLMAIQGNTSLMLFETGETHPHYEMLKSIERSVQNGAKLTRQLLDYARKERYEVTPTDLNELVAETLESFQRARRQIQISQNLALDLRSVEADSAQIEQVLLNLYLNAADAMPRGGRLSVETRNVTDEDMQSSSYKPRKGPYVLLSVADTGVGMEKEIQERIFEPFFTTKELGKGTGLGLASVYGIIKGHGGYIDVQSVLGRGTTFKVYLPASKKRAKRQKTLPQNVTTGQETILIVDDEETFRDVASKMLQRLGYKTFMAESAARALEIFREKKDDIDLIILDMIMPGMQGGEVYDRVKEINPDVKVLLASGYSINGDAKEVLKRGCNGFIQKPFDMRTLSRKVGKYCARKAPALDQTNASVTKASNRKRGTLLHC